MSERSVEYADLLIVPAGDGQEAIKVVHESCGRQLLLTMTVHLDTLVRLADDHECPASSPGTPTSHPVEATP